MKKRNKLIAILAPLVLGVAVLVSQKVQAKEADYQIILNDGQGCEHQLATWVLDDDNQDEFNDFTEDDYLLASFHLSAEQLDHVDRDLIGKKIIINLKKPQVKHQATGIKLSGYLDSEVTSRFHTFLQRYGNKGKFKQCFHVNLDHEVGFVSDKYLINTFQYGDDSKIAIKYGEVHELDLANFTSEQRQAVAALCHGQSVDLANCPLDHAEFDNLQKFSELGLSPQPLKMTYLFYQDRNRKTYYRPVFSMERLAGAVQLGDYLRYNQVPLADQKEVAKNFLNALIRLHDQGIVYGGDMEHNVLVDPQTHQISFVSLGHSCQDPGDSAVAFKLKDRYQDTLYYDNNQFFSRCLNVFRKNFNLKNIATNYLSNRDRLPEIDRLKIFKAEASDLIDQLKPIFTAEDLVGLSPRQQKAKEEVYQIARNEMRFDGEIKFDPTQSCPISRKKYVDCNKLALVCLKQEAIDHQVKYFCRAYDYEIAVDWFSDYRHTDPETGASFDHHDPKCFFTEVYVNQGH